MCEWGTGVELTVTIPTELSYTGHARQKVIGVDSCIAPVVKALNDGGVATIASCCGHGNLPPSIVLGDRRELRILTSEQSRALDRLIGRDIHGQSPTGISGESDATTD